MKMKFTGHSRIESQAGVFEPGRKYDIDPSLFDESVMEQIVEEAPVKKVNKVGAEKTTSTKNKIRDYIKDIEDDGKRNYSNDPTKKSPGRKTKKKSKFKRTKRGD